MSEVEKLNSIEALDDSYTIQSVQKCRYVICKHGLKGIKFSMNIGDAICYHRYKVAFDLLYHHEMIGCLDSLGIFCRQNQKHLGRCEIYVWRKNHYFNKMRWCLSQLLRHKVTRLVQNLPVETRTRPQIYEETMTHRVSMLFKHHFSTHSESLILKFLWERMQTYNWKRAFHGETLPSPLLFIREK